MDLNARVDVNCGRKDGRRDGRSNGKQKVMKVLILFFFKL